MNYKKRIKEIVTEEIKKVLKENSFEEKLDIEKIFNFDFIPLEELEKQYVDLSFTVSSSGYGGRFMGINGKILKEEATSTLSIEETKNEIKNKFRLKDWQFATQSGANGIRLIILYPGILKNAKLIKEAMAACGWSLAIKGYTIKKRMIWKAMSFDPIFQENVSSEVRNYNHLFHWTPMCNYDSIKVNGLQPRSENKIFDYPNRLHLIKGDVSEEEIMSIGWQLCFSNKNKNNNSDYVLLSIDLNKVPENTEFYYDPRYEGGYYTKAPIPSEAISKIFTYNFKLHK